MLHHLEPRYRPPSRHTISEKIIPAWCQAERDKLHRELKAARAVSLTSDGWTSRNTVGYLTITAHFLQNWELKSKVLQTEMFEGNHTGENIGRELASALQKWEIKDKVKVMTVDNAANMGVGVFQAGIELKLGCFAHCINLASNKATAVPEIARVLGKIRKLVTLFHKSDIATEVLTETQKALQVPLHRLVMDVKTRWNSTFDMIQRFLEQRPALLATLLDPRIRRLNEAKMLASLEDMEVSYCEEYVQVMDIMVKTTVVISAEKKPTAGLILPLMDKIKQHFMPHEGDSKFMVSAKKAVGDNIATRYLDEGLVKFLQEASALDPRTKLKKCIDDQTWERIISKCEEVLVSE